MSEESKKLSLRSENGTTKSVYERHRVEWEVFRENPQEIIQRLRRGSTGHMCVFNNGECLHKNRA
jgi:hypothetical protein